MFPTQGDKQQLTGKVTIPGSDLQFYKVSFDDSHYYPLDKEHSWVLLGRVKLAYGGGYGQVGGFDQVLPSLKIIMPVAMTGCVVSRATV